MSKKCLFDWLSKNRDKDVSWDRCIANFAASLAASCVFEYVLGLGDRHSGNLLIKRDGTLFHIDFGWILGYEVPNWGERERVLLCCISPCMYVRVSGINTLVLQGCFNPLH